MPCTFVNNIWSGRILYVFQLPNITGNDKDVISLEFHKRIRWDKPINSYCGPTNFLQYSIHAVHVWDTVY